MGSSEAWSPGLSRNTSGGSLTELLSAAQSSLSKTSSHPLPGNQPTSQLPERGMSRLRGPPDILEEARRGRDLHLSAWWWCEAGEPAGQMEPPGVGAEIGVGNQSHGVETGIVRERDVLGLQGMHVPNPS